MFPIPIPLEPGCLCVKHNHPAHPFTNWRCILWHGGRAFELFIGHQEIVAPRLDQLVQLHDAYPDTFSEITPKSA